MAEPSSVLDVPARLHTSPNRNSPYQQLPPGTKFEVIQAGENWLKIRFGFAGSGYLLEGEILDTQSASSLPTQPGTEREPEKEWWEQLLDE